ncbi:hypothetical protein BOTBODRAFT_192069 [Botryobasidium botryosum FD-172 SS1]|uniref:RRM domain-containing protein n=1 Tax=Botryobasidium botryosum (strain FD-172 SS1) TaxID=930990 RepID=A0A067LZU6_BOTB1|nr:hypothetical protein BOTBODRAFT_192069 [Botryobasidium botryosum FD-172 SS1]
MRSTVHIAGQNDALEYVSDTEIRTIFGPYGRIIGIHRWRNEKTDVLHFFIDFSTVDSAVAASRYRDPKYRWISLLATTPGLYDVYRKAKAQSKAPARYPAIAASPSSSSTGAHDIQSRSVSTPHPNPSTPLAPEAKGASDPRGNKYPLTYAPIQTPDRSPYPSSGTNELASAPGNRPAMPPISLNPAYTKPSGTIEAPYPINSAIKRMFESDSEEECDADYAPSRESRRRRRSGSVERVPSLESIELVQERLRCSELESRAQDAGDRLAALQRRVEQLAAEKQMLEGEAIERAAHGAELKEHCEALERQLVEANARVVGAREELASKKATRDAEMEARCELLGELAQAEEARIATIEKVEKGSVERGVWEAEMTQRCEALERDWEEARAKEREECEVRQCLSAQRIVEEAELRRRCERLEMELAESLGSLLEAEKDREQLKRMVDGAFIVPALQRAFLQIDGLLKELVETAPT